ncbi:MAG: serine hydrolase domain-containing protein [Gemmatimonadales bacterium]
MFRCIIHGRVLPLLLMSTAACARLARPETVYLDKVVAPDPVAGAADAVMRQFAAEGFTGSVLIARGSRVLLSKGYGDANRARELPNNAETKYPFGALTNMFTAAAILGLESEGRLRLDQPVSDWVGAEAGTVTLRELLTRAREVSDQNGLVHPARYVPPSSAVERFRSTGWSYELLERVLGAVTGEPATAALTSRLFLPAGLTRTVMDDGRLNDSLVARGYTGGLGETVVVTGLVGPLADLWHWHQALRLGTLLPLAVRQRMQTPTAQGYGMGWVVGRTDAGVRVIEHASDQPGFQIWYGYFPDKDLLILLAVNSDLGFRRPIAERLTTLLVETGVSSAASIVTPNRTAGGG